MFEYTLKKSARAKLLRISISRTGEVIVTVPYRVSTTQAGKFILEKKTWIEEKIRLMKKRAEKNPNSISPRGTPKELEEYREKALTLVLERLTHFNVHYRLKWNNVTIKNTSSRWGSCSKKGNLNFNYKIIKLSPELTDYLVVHELCHLQQFNHSKKFWELVGEAIPNYRVLRKELRGIS